MISRLTTYHDLQAIPIIQNFVVQTGLFLGADEQEGHQLELAAEEAAAFIVTTFKPDPEELFVIECEPVENGLRVSFRNRGLPVDEENLPIYDSRNPENSIEGLPFFLLERVTDSFRFVNEGNKGWVLIFVKYLAHCKTLQHQQVLDEADVKQYAAEKLEVGIAAPSDAYDIVKLTYLTYRYSYAKAIFYYREILQQAIADGSVIAFVAKNHQGEVVVNSSYLRSPSCREIVEAGMLMSQPEYRKNRALLRVSRKQAQYFKQGKGGLRIAVANLVTTHTGSQRLVRAFGFVPLALKLSVHDMVDFVGVDTRTKHRESLLYALCAPHGVEPAVIHLPSQHHKITRTLIEAFETLQLSSAMHEPEFDLSTVTVNRYEHDHAATITFEQIGCDWLSRLHMHLRELDADGYITIHLRLPADTPLPPSLEDSLQRLNFFYCGIMIKTLTSWELLYTALHGQRFDFNAINLAYSRALELKASMQRAWNILEEQV